MFMERENSSFVVLIKKVIFSNKEYWFQLNPKKKKEGQ